MYRLNPLDRNVLITSDEVIKKAPINGDVDTRILQNSIEVAEERFIVNILSDAVYEDFITQKNVVVTDANKNAMQALVNASNTGPTITLKVGQRINAIELVTDEWYKKLWDRFLWKITAECVAYVFSTSNWIRSTAQGEMLNNPKSVTMEGQSAASAELKDLKFKLDRQLMDRINPLIEAMKKWLYTNRTYFTKYPSNYWDEDATGVSINRGWVHGIYEDEKSGCDYYED